MRLGKWLELNKVSIGIFASRIGKNRSLVHKYIYEDVIPKPAVIKAIYCETFGAVSANDFYRLSDQLFEKNNDKIYEDRVLHANSFQ